MKIIAVPCQEDGNYMYIINDEINNIAAVVDPFDLAKLEAAAKKANLTLGSIALTTHHHEDHSGGNEEFIAKYPGVAMYAGSTRSPGADHLVSLLPPVEQIGTVDWFSYPVIELMHNDTFKIGTLEVCALWTPCHTQDHICYFVEDKVKNQRAVFTGDTLFISGCGNFEEGPAEEMHEALNVKLAGLPDDTVTYIGHEYTKRNVRFAKSIEPTNPDILRLEDFCNRNEVATGVSTLGDEKKWNVFMRVHTDVVRTATKTNTSVEAMAKLREMKNQFDS